jgi:hypothetical protein
MFATADRGFGASGGLSRVEDDGSFTELSDYPSGDAYRSGSNDWRGFAWAPLTPDGEFALAANNVWGNSRQSVVGISNREVSVPDYMVSGGNGIGLLGRYFRNATFSGAAWQRTDPIVNFVWGAGAPGPMPADAFSAIWTGYLQPYYSESHLIAIETQGGVRLSIGGQILIDELDNEAEQTFTANVDLVRGEFYNIELRYKDTAGDAKVALWWSSNSTPLQVIPQTQLDWNDLGHGVLVSYFDENNFTDKKLTRVEPVVGADWKGGAPSRSMGADHFSSIWEGRLDAPYSGQYTFCANTDDDIRVDIGGVKVLERGVGDGCGSAFTLAAGKHTLRVEHREYTGNAYVRLDWQIAVASETLVPREMIPHENLLLPTGYNHLGNGVMVTYYDDRDFNRSLTQNQVSPRAVRRIEPNIDYDWGNAASREEFQILTANTDISGRWTGTLTATCTGVTEFYLDADDGAHLWLNGIRVASNSGCCGATGSYYMDNGASYDFKFEWDQGGGGARARVLWKPCGNGAYTVVPQSAFVPTGGRQRGGFTRAGGDNASGVDYFIWKTPDTVGVSAQDVTATSPGKWGLAGATMMVPAFSPDASKLVFVDGDQAGGAGWRKGLSVFDFSQNGRVFKNRRTIVDNWPFGDVIKWPTFESDSRSVIYSASPPATHCCINGWTLYGYMAPTDYYETPGKLFSVDVESAVAEPVYLEKASNGERDEDANKAWQPTMLPVSAGGYRWVVFTSTRPYGNTLNLNSQEDYTDTSSYNPMLDYRAIQSQLWIAAVDDETSGSTDRSHPAFWLPNQNFDENPDDGFVNERGFWALDPCRPTGNGAESLCDVAEDCCGALEDPPTATCRLDLPITSPITRHCQVAVTQNSCILPGGGCGSTEECCPGTVCVDGVCAKPPDFDTYAPGNFDRVYEADCDIDSVGEWHFFDWKVTTPETDSFIEFYVQTADDPDDFVALPVAPEAVNIPGVYLLAKVEGAQDPSVWSGVDVGKLFADNDLLEGRFVKITMRFSPNTELTASPILRDFRMTYSCPPGQ